MNQDLSGFTIADLDVYSGSQIVSITFASRKVEISLIFAV